MKRLHGYHRGTLSNLKEVLLSGPDCPAAFIMLRKIAPVVIPWGSHDKYLTKEELNAHIDDYIISCFGGYEGSPQGYSSFRQNMWEVLALRYGVLTADNLCMDVMDYHKCSIVDGHVVLEGVKCTKHYVYYTEKMVQYVDAMEVPELRKLTEEDKMEVALPFILDYGELAISLPVLGEIDEDTKQLCKKTVRDRIHSKYGKEVLDKLDASEGVVSLSDLRSK